VLPPPFDAPLDALVYQVDLSHELGEVIQLLLRVGTLLACSGAAAFRVREAMQRTAVSLGVKRSEFVVNIDAITASIFHRGEFRTQVARLPPVGVDMSLLCRLELLTRALLSEAGSHTPSQVHEKLDGLQKSPRLYPRWVTVPCLGAACAAFCAAGHGTWSQMLCAFVGASLGHTVRLQLLARRIPLVSIVIVCAFVSCATAELAAWPLSSFVPAAELSHAKSGIGILASVLYLIPGVPLVTSLIDLVHLDLNAGLSRAVYAAVLVASIAVGMFCYFAVSGFLP
jgi:uncharacterized membrane protein YjjP (DUF1212 family)